MADLYDDAVRVIDEDGKGAEILRQQSTGPLENGTNVVMVAEVDMIIRSLTAVSNGVDPTAGTVRFYRHPPGGSQVELTEAQAVAGMGADDVLEIPLSVARNAVKKGDIVKVTIAALNANVKLTALVGWMPDIFNPEADYRSY